MASLLLTPAGAALRLMSRAPTGAALAATAAAAARAPPARAWGAAGSSSRPRSTHTVAAAADELALAPAAEAAPPPLPGSAPPVFAGFNVYKGRGALNVKPMRPKWKATPSGGFQIEREGALMFELAPSLGERRYDWDNKVAVSMSALELAAILTDPDAEHSFYHDTYKGQPGREGSLVKTVKWSRSQDGSAYFINASAQDKAAGRSLTASVSLTRAEFYVLRRLIDASFTYLLGWDVVFTHV